MLDEGFYILYKKDWNEAKKVFEEWWEGTLSRPLIQLIGPKDGPVSGLDSWAFLRYHPDAEKAMDLLFSQFSNMIFEKEAYPNVWVNLGPGSLSAYLGGDLRFDGRVNTSWFRGAFSLDDLQQMEFDPDNEWWRYTCHAYEVAARRCEDKAVVAFTDLLDAVTVAAQLRGDFPTVLLKDMFLEGPELKKALERVHELFFQYYDESCKLINTPENGYSTWAGLWSKKSHFTLQCDLMVYLSPRMFREFIYPLIIKECGYFERTIWHLDGPLELNHVDDLLSIPELDCIQWIPGEGNPDPGETCWVPLYKKIQEKEKLIQIFVPPQKVMRILSRISPKGVAVNTVCETRGQMEELLKEIEKRYA